eukprot:scaffold57281_cov29-Attheya_sp.AAC.1
MPLTQVSSAKISTTPTTPTTPVSSKGPTDVTTNSQIPPSPVPSHAQIPTYHKPPLNHGISRVTLGKSLPTKNKVKQSAKDVLLSDDVLLQVAIEGRKLPFLFSQCNVPDKTKLIPSLVPVNKAMEKEASNESNEDSDSAEENSDEEDDRKMPAITSKVVRKRTKHKKSQEGNNQSKLTFQYEVGERKDKQGRRSWTSVVRKGCDVHCVYHSLFNTT